MSEDNSCFPLFTASIFPVTTPAEGRRWLNLRELLTHPAADARISHPYAYLDMVCQSLASALTQVLYTDSDLPRPLRKQLVTGEAAISDDLIEKLFAASSQKAGFDLMGTSAFLQVPRPLLAKKSQDGVVTQVSPEPISGLFSPFLARSTGNSTAKSLRQMVHIDYCCPACTAAGVMSTQLFSPSMAQYWGRSQASGSLYFWLSVEGDFSLGRSIFANMADNPGDHDDVLFPWVADNAERNGLDESGYPPYARLFESGELLETTISRQLPFVRGVRLDRPVDRNRACDLCGQHAPWGFEQFFLMPEPMLQAALPAGRGPVDDKGKPIDSGILARRVEPNVRHPGLAYVPRKNKKPSEDSADGDEGDDGAGAFTPLSQRQDAASVDGVRPTWISVEGMLGDVQTADRPEVLKQMAVFSRHTTRYQLTVFSVNAESATNPNPHSVVYEQYGVSALAGATPETERHLKGVLQHIQKTIDAQIIAWIAAAERLGYDTEKKRRESDGEIVLVEKKPHRTRFKALRTAVKTDGALRDYGRQLWDLGLQYVSQLMDGKTQQNTAQFLAESAQAINAQGYIFWQDYLRQKTPPNPDIGELFLISKATAEYRKKAPKPDKGDTHGK